MFRIIKGAPVEQADQVVPLRKLVLSATEEQPTAEPTVTAEESLAIAQQQATEMVAKAKQEATHILTQAKIKAETMAQQIKEQAKRDGWHEGITAAEVEAENIRRQASEVLLQARKIYHDTLESMEPEIVDLAVDIAERVVLAQLAVEPRTVMEIAKECMDLIKNRPLVNIYVNNVDYQLVQADKNELLQGLPGKVELHILTDHGISPGGCRIETDQGLVDATLETRWQEVLKALYGRED